MGTIKLKKASTKEEQASVTAVATGSNAENVTAEKRRWDDPAVLKEFSEKADEMSRHYKLNNGTAKSIISAAPSNYFDENEQKWKPIDNSLTEKEWAYESISGKYKTEISKPEKGKSIKMTASGIAISWEYLGRQSTSEVQAQPFAFEGDALPTTLEVEPAIEGALQSKSSKATYENADKDTDIEYGLSGNNIKENIIVKERAEEYRYLFALNTQGLKLRVSEDNESLELYTETVSESGETLTKTEATIPAPFMYDANGESSDDVYFELAPETDGKYTFAVVASAEWINEENRAFPVKIDPQIVVNTENLVTKQTYYRNISTGSGSGSGISYSSWYKTSTTDIRVYKTSSIEYKTALTVQKKVLDLLALQISSAKLILTPKSNFSGYLYVNNKSQYYNASNNSKLELDITNQYKSSNSEFVVELRASSSYVNMLFAMEGDAPIVEVEYLTNENVRPPKKTFSLGGVGAGTLNLATGDFVPQFEDISAENSAMGLAIQHLYKKNANNYLLGSNFRLSLHESLVRNGDTTYVYTDGNGDKHGFQDYYYYVNASGQKVYIEDKTKVVVNPEGALTYQDESTDEIYKVTLEFKSTSGLKAMATLEGVKNVDYYEQRSEDLKNAEDTVNDYKNSLNEFVRMSSTSGQITDKLSNHDLTIEGYEQFKANLTDNEMLLPISEAMNYNAALMQLRVLNYQDTSYSYEQQSLQLQIDSIANRNGLCPAELGYLDDQISALDTQRAILNIQETYYNGAAGDGDQKDYSKTYFNALKSKISTQENELIQQQNYLDVKKQELGQQYSEQDAQKSLLNNQKSNIGTIRNENDAQSDYYDQQISIIAARRDFYLQQLEKLFVEYLAVEKQYQNMVLQLPVNFLTDGKFIKGYNKYGDFVAFYDAYENYAVVEYEDYYEGPAAKRRIFRLYDNKENVVQFSYNYKNQLSAITDIGGRKTSYVYEGDELKAIQYDSGKKLTISYLNGNISSVAEEKTGLKTDISYSNNRPTLLSQYSTVDNIAAENTETSKNLLISKSQIAYNPAGSDTINYVTITENLKKERYYFDSWDNCIEYRLEENGVVTQAEKYTHNPYWIGDEKQSDPKEVVIKAAKTSLYKTSLDSYTFVSGDTETTIIDQFNNPSQTTTNAIVIAKWNGTDGSAQQNTQTTKVEYTYDDNQRLTEEKTTTTFSNPAKTIISHKKYNYNVYGEVVRTESYVEGEELTTGKTIEETVFDAYGNAIKSYTYNSLDSSSKLYTESEYSEDGKVLSDFDETGEYKTQYKYADGTANIKEDILPNGSRFAYGFDNDTVTAISHSTEEGVENSTQRIYNYGEVVGLRSGNTDVQYKYNHKRKLISVGLNGDAAYVTYNRVEKTNTAGAVTGETITATYSSGDVFVSETDGNGNVLKTTANGAIQSENVYEKKSLLILKDKIAGKNYHFAKDDLDRLTEVYEVNDSDARISGYTEKYEYDSYGSLIKKTIAEGDLSQEYTYTYNTDAKRAIASIAAGGITVKPQLDKLERNKGKELYISGMKVAEEIISYRKAGDHATNMPSVMSFGNMQSGKYVIKDSIRYAYDEMGNITKVYENGELAARYKYDALSRLIREDNKAFEKTWLYSYDNNGNILKQRAFAFTMKDEEELEELASESREYVYKGDRLESYNGEACEYNDAAGNPTTYRGTAATWTNGRLASYKGATFTYDGQGRRASKGSVTYMYDSQSRLVKQSNGLEYYYDHSGVSGVKYNGNTYIYRKDIQGNICAILDSTGNVVVEYKYDAWGNHAVLNASGGDIEEGTHIGNLNPFRYRGYYYDTETGTPKRADSSQSTESRTLTRKQSTA